MWRDWSDRRHRALAVTTGLQFVEFGVVALRPHQLPVAARFDNPPLVHNDDEVSGRDRGKAVGDEQGDRTGRPAAWAAAA